MEGEFEEVADAVDVVDGPVPAVEVAVALAEEDEVALDVAVADAVGSAACVNPCTAPLTGGAP